MGITGAGFGAGQWETQPGLHLGAWLEEVMMVWVSLKSFLSVGSTFRTGLGTRSPGVVHSSIHPGGFLGAAFCA